MFRYHNIEYDGYTVRDSGNWSHTHFKCRNIYAHDLTVLGGHDGFHCRMCDNILVEDCRFYTGDDCVAGFDNQNMVVRSCYMDCACSAMRLGGTDILIDRCLNDIIFRNCRAIGVSMPLELLSDKDEQVTFRLENVEISAREGYEDVDFMHAENFKEIHFRNVKVSGYRHTPTIKTKTDGPIYLVDTEGIAIQKVEDYE